MASQMEFTGRAREAELGAGWTAGVHPDDRGAYLATAMQAFDHRDAFRTERREEPRQFAVDPGQAVGERIAR